MCVHIQWLTSYVWHNWFWNRNVELWWCIAVHAWIDNLFVFIWLGHYDFGSIGLIIYFTRSAVFSEGGTRFTTTTIILYNEGTNHWRHGNHQPSCQPAVTSRTEQRAGLELSPSDTCCAGAPGVLLVQRVWRKRCSQVKQLLEGLSVGRGWFLQVRTRGWGEYADMLSCLHSRVAGGFAVR